MENFYFKEVFTVVKSEVIINACDFGIYCLNKEKKNLEKTFKKKSYSYYLINYEEFVKDKEPSIKNDRKSNVEPPPSLTFLQIAKIFKNEEYAKQKFNLNPNFCHSFPQIYSQQYSPKLKSTLEYAKRMLRSKINDHIRPIESKIESLKTLREMARCSIHGELALYKTDFEEIRDYIGKEQDFVSEEKRKLGTFHNFLEI